MHSARRRRRVMAEINIVPYIDVMLVLLVIFMVTAPLLSQGVKVNLPKAKAKALSDQHKAPIIVSVNKRGELFLNIAADNKKAISPQQILNVVSSRLQQNRRKHQHQAVLVKGDTAVDYGKVVQAMVLLQKAGAKQIGLITQPGSHDHVKRFA